MTNWVISSSVFILAIILLRRICKGKISLSFQYALWLFVAFRLLIPFNFGQSELSIENLIAKISEQSQVKSEIQMSEQWPADIDYAGFYENVIEQYTSQRNSDTEVGTSGLAENVNMMEIAQKVCLYIWMLGVIISGTTFVATNFRFSAKLKKSRKKVEVAYSSLPVYISEEVETPCLVGITKSGIYVTKTVAENPALLKHAVYHEMTHYRHKDQLWSVVRCICLVLHWYNPLVWWAAVLSKKDAEFACDEGTIRKLGEEERTEYGKTLIQLTCEKRHDILLAATTMISGKKDINERITLIAEKPRIRKYAVVLAIIVVLAGVVGTFTEAKAEPKEEVEFGIGQQLDEINWRKIGAELSEEKYLTLQKYQHALEGGMVTWIGESASESQLTIQKHIEEDLERMGLEADTISVESFLFADVFQSGEQNICLLIRHVSKSWIILHEEDGVIYGIDMSALNFKGIQENGVYYRAGGRGIQYYEKMTFTECNCCQESIGTMLGGQLNIEGKMKTESEYQQWQQDNMNDETPIYTFVREKL